MSRVFLTESSITRVILENQTFYTHRVSHTFKLNLPKNCWNASRVPNNSEITVTLQFSCRFISILTKNTEFFRAPSNFEYSRVITIRVESSSSITRFLKMMLEQFRVEYFLPSRVEYSSILILDTALLIHLQAKSIFVFQLNF